MNKSTIFFSFLSVALVVGCSQSIQQNNMQNASFPSFSAEAHRGGRGLMPENTIIAMQNAMTFDAVTTLEMDTHITKDGKVVVTHDDYLSPSFMLTPEGKEIPKSDAQKYPIYQMEYDLLKTFDIGTKANTGFPQQKKIKTHISLLADLIDFCSKRNQVKKQKTTFLQHRNKM